jgi:Lon protease-like protein
MRLPLHVFEPRYREMINGCIAERRPFGVALIRAGQEVGGPAQPHPIGTTGMISRVERLPDGRLNIEVVGQERFRILQVHREQAYLTGTVQDFPLAEADCDQARRAAQSLAPWVTRYLQQLAQASAASLQSQPLPAHPAALAYLAGIVAQVPMRDKQTLLETASALDLLERERCLFRREVALLHAMLSSGQSGHNADLSPN